MPTLLWLETPSNPKLEVYDIAELAGTAHAGGALTVVDNTTAGPLLQRPLDLGADVTLTSATKQMAGHADLMLGYVTTRDAEPRRAHARLAPRRRRAGRPVRGLARAPLAAPRSALRLERGSENALALARLLAARDDVPSVRYPGLPGDPGPRGGPAPDARLRDGRSHSTSARQERAERFLAAARLVTDATSFGGVHTTAERRARWGGDDVPPGFIRLSAGCEDTADLLADVERALDSV